MGTQLIVPDIRLPLDAASKEAFAPAKRRLSRYLSVKDAECRIFRRSIDARKKENLTFVYSVAVTLRENVPERLLEKMRRDKITVCPDGDFDVKYGNTPLRHRIAVIGFGPAGMFAAMLLSEHGYMPLVLERGGDAADRTAAVTRFFRDKILDTENNIQFGAGGAGTFSDGKLMTRIGDPKCLYVLRKFHALGAPEDILYQAKPHVGTDHLKPVVENMTAYIRKTGGEIRFHTAVRSIDETAEGVTLSLSDGETVLCDAVILAIGHSARDTYEMLLGRGFDITPKPFSVGVRIEHLQKEIDWALYGDGNMEKYRDILPKGEYTLSLREDDRAVYSFCMCPGGQVVAAASEAGGVCVNGMSNYKRDGANANCALAVSVSSSDIGENPRDGIAFQRMLEQRAFASGGGDYSVPIATVGDFLNRTAGTEPTGVKPTYMEGTAYRVSDLETILPSFVAKMLRRGITKFDRQINGFAAPDAILSAVETRTSAPVRILRDDSRQATRKRGVYPCGEGAGYAGGIMSAAIDGINTALSVMEQFAPKKR